MSAQVLALAERRSAVSDPLEEKVSIAFEKLLTVPGVSYRAGQKELALAVARSMIENRPLLAEAPTGTGKTLAYLIGGLVAREELAPIGFKKLVVSTATKGLQSQVLDSDMAKIREAGLLQGMSVELAKGRGNYLCVRQAEIVAEQGGTSQLDLLNADANASESLGAAADARRALDLFRTGEWAGDADRMPGQRPRTFKIYSANSDTCVGKKCQHFEVCPLMASRTSIAVADVLVANHDLVLADLQMWQDEIDPLLAESYLVVFDEGHHLPDKALEVGQSKVGLNKLREELNILGNDLANLSRNPKVSTALSKANVSRESFDFRDVLVEVAHLRDLLEELGTEGNKKHRRFAKGEVPDALKGPCASLSRILGFFAGKAEEGQALVRFGSMSKWDGPDTPLATAVQSLFGKLRKVLHSAHVAFAAFAGEGRKVRWVEKDVKAEQAEWLVCSSVTEGAETLRPLLWDESDRIRPVIVSATLQDLKGFERFKVKSGVPFERVRTHITESIFDYSRVEMVVGKMENTPRPAQRAAFIAELRQVVPEFIVPGTGNLVLFHAESVMREVVPMLRRRYGDAVRSQRDGALPALLEAHRKDAEAGRTAILCGMATLAEGLDLPGKGVENLILTQLPFAVPDSPVEEEVQDVLGSRYFSERSLPDTFVKLVQMAGRLMRRVDDRGRIVVLDKRLGTEGWGRKMLARLPQYARKRFERESDRNIEPALRSVPSSSPH